MKKTFSLVVLLLCMTLGVTAQSSGTCGANLNWSFEGNTLTITGSGAMTNYESYNSSPWYSIRESIVQVSLPEELTTIGKNAFNSCTKLRLVTIPANVTTIANNAFDNCQALSRVTSRKDLRSRR